MHQSIKIQDKWQELIRMHKASGSSVSEFCVDHKLSTKTFYNWRKRLSVNQSIGGFMRVSVPNGELMPSVVESKVIRIKTPNGYSVCTKIQNESGLRNILEVLKCL